MKQNLLNKVWLRIAMIVAVVSTTFAGTAWAEDEVKDLEDGVQKLTDKYVANVDKAVEAKTKEILTV